MTLSAAKVTQIEFLSQMKQIIKGGRMRNSAAW